MCADVHVWAEQIVLRTYPDGRGLLVPRAGTDTPGGLILGPLVGFILGQRVLELRKEVPSQADEGTKCY